MRRTPCCAGDTGRFAEPGGGVTRPGDAPPGLAGGRRGATAPSADSCSSPSRRMAASMSLPQSCRTSVITCGCMLEILTFKLIQDSKYGASVRGHGRLLVMEMKKACASQTMSAPDTWEGTGAATYLTSQQLLTPTSMGALLVVDL